MAFSVSKGTSQTFSNRLDLSPIGGVDEAWAVECMNDTCYFVVAHETSQGLVGVSLMSMTSDGEFETTIELSNISEHVYSGTQECLFQHNQTLYFCGSESSGDSVFAYIATYTPATGSWSKDLIDNGHDRTIARTLIVEDDAIYLVGSVADFDQNGEWVSDGYVAKFNMDLGLLWEHVYPTESSSNHVTSLYQLDVRTELGLVAVSGVTHIADLTYHQEAFVGLLQTDGMALWKTILEEDEDYESPSVDVKISADGSLIWAGGQHTNCYDYCGNIGYWELSILGEIMDTHSFGIPGYASFFRTTQTLENGGFAEVGSYYSDGSQSAALFKVDPDHQLESISLINPEPGIEARFNDIFELDDGRFVAVGYAFFNFDLGYGYDSFVAVTHEHGCIEQDCVLSASEFDRNSLASVRVFPNPSCSIIRVNSDLGILSLTLHDMHGRQVLRNTRKSILQVDLVPDGAYVLTIQLEGMVEVVKHVFVRH